jgi:hypothetical protein
MPKVRRARLPEALFDHLIERADQRKIAFQDIVLLGKWLDSEPIVPNGRWYKRFQNFTLCGEGELVKTFLLPTQSVTGQEVY